MAPNEIVKNISVNHGNKALKADVEVWGRDGSKSPATWIILFNGRRITPFEQRVRGWEFPLHAMFQMLYQNPIKDMMEAMGELPSVFKATKKSAWSGGYMVVPLRTK